MDEVTNPDFRLRRCTVCHGVFEVPRGLGRPPEKCSEPCRRRAHGTHQRTYIRRLIDARRQLAELQAA